MANAAITVFFCDHPPPLRFRKGTAYSGRCYFFSIFVFLCGLFLHPAPLRARKRCFMSASADAVPCPSFSVATLPPLRALKGLLSYNINMADDVNSAAFFSGHFSPSRPPKGLPILANAAIIITVFLGSQIPPFHVPKWYLMVADSHILPSSFVASFLHPAGSCLLEPMLCCIRLFLWLLFPSLSS